MLKIDAKKLYQEMKRGERAYKEETHCPMIIDVMNTEGTMTAFCRKALISDGLFSKWTKKHKLFNDCYQLGKMLSRYNWEKEGEDGAENPEFNFDQWRLKGAYRYGIGRGRVRMNVDPEANPYEQYKQLVEQASYEEFNASEIKQLMESINVGIRAFESFELQGQMNEMVEEIKRMKLHHANNSSAIASITKTD